MQFCAKYGNEKAAIAKTIASDEEPGSENESKEKEKTTEQEKYFSDDNYIASSKYHFCNSNTFICLSIPIHLHPYQDDDIQPPKAA